MKLGIMQPYLFPYIGYFQLISAVDIWVVFDDVQYIRHGWVNRNRILSPNIQKEWQYITVPIQKFKREDFIEDIKINNTVAWQNSILGKLSYYKQIKAPFYSTVQSLVKEMLEKKYDSIVELNIRTIQSVCDYLGVEFNYRISSKEKYDYSHVSGAGD